MSRERTDLENDSNQCEEKREILNTASSEKYYISKTSSILLVMPRGKAALQDLEPGVFWHPPRVNPSTLAECSTNLYPASVRWSALRLPATSSGAKNILSDWL